MKIVSSKKYTNCHFPSRNAIIIKIFLYYNRADHFSFLIPVSIFFWERIFLWLTKKIELNSWLCLINFFYWKPFTNNKCDWCIPKKKFQLNQIFFFALFQSKIETKPWIICDNLNGFKPRWTWFDKKE